MRNLAIMGAMVLWLISFTKIQELGCLSDTVLEPLGERWEALTERVSQVFDQKTCVQECRLADSL